MPVANGKGSMPRPAVYAENPAAAEGPQPKRRPRPRRKGDLPAHREAVTEAEVLRLAEMPEPTDGEAGPDPVADPGRGEAAPGAGTDGVAAGPLPAPALGYYYPLTKPEGRTDTNNAAGLRVRYGDVSRWVGPWDKWLLWDGSRWRMDQARAVDLRAKDIAADLFIEIAAALREGGR
jgi:hypothetical protein